MAKVICSDFGKNPKGTIGCGGRDVGERKKRRGGGEKGGEKGTSEGSSDW